MIAGDGQTSHVPMGFDFKHPAPQSPGIFNS